MTIKGLSAAAAFWIAYIDKNFSPLFWLLIFLVLADLVLNAHKEGQQFSKIGSMAISLGLPSYIISNFAHTDFFDLVKYVIAALCLVYLQIVVPAVRDKLKNFKFSSNPKENAVDTVSIDAIVEKVAANMQAKAQMQVAATVEQEPKAPTIIDGGAAK